MTNPPYGNVWEIKHQTVLYIWGLSALLQKNFPNQRAAIIAAQVEQADVLAFNDPQTLRLMNGKLPIYVRFGTIKPATVTQPFWQHGNHNNLKKSRVLKDFTNRLQKTCRP